MAGENTVEMLTESIIQFPQLKEPVTEQAREETTERIAQEPLRIGAIQIFDANKDNNIQSYFKCDNDLALVWISLSYLLLLGITFPLIYLLCKLLHSFYWISTNIQME